MSVHLSSNPGAGGISPVPPNLVKPCAAVLSALPVIALSASKRRFALVCLSARLNACRAEQHCLHRYTTKVAQLSAIRQSLEEIIVATDAPTLVIEADVDSRRSLQIAKSSIVRWAEEHGLAIVRISRAYACREICEEPDVRVAAARIASRYPRLAREVFDSHGAVRTSAEHWQVRQPIIAAFLLAHAFACRSVVNAFGGLIPPHPKPEYVRRDP